MKEIHIMNHAVLAARAALFNISHSQIMMHKKDLSPVTLADLTVNQQLKEILLGSFSDYGWLSEETQDDFSRLNKKRVFIVDPIDGTKEYIHHISEYVISIALVEDGEPLCAVILNPATSEHFYAIKGQGAYLNQQPIRCHAHIENKLTVLASRSEVKKGHWQPFTDHFTVKPTGSIAYKLALLAASHAHATLSLTPKNEWDIAAGVLLVKEAGGIVHDLDKKPFVFNQKNTLVNGIIASHANAYQHVIMVLDQSKNYQACDNSF